VIEGWCCYSKDTVIMMISFFVVVLFLGARLQGVLHHALLFEERSKKGLFFYA